MFFLSYLRHLFAGQSAWLSTCISTAVCCYQLVVLTRYQVILVMSPYNVRLIDQIRLCMPKMKLF
ncbi:hypothetical protein AVDCRST_MAG94-468 [uncultured Leptolyngbya sp.]|uniref:Uncharacterized protein n=1 Tax=uncultured Leptolyngbya sp. TaxID=332963 RepID=A0A6J4KDD7_9CYAN|nr:hypothetical protein AVDCRST_MAG94-468 [uncultured Leptolyngbya sp.]